MKQYYIYLTTNQLNNKKYIGQHFGELNDDYLGSGTLITKAIKAHGKENFSKEILEICETREQADERKKFYIQQHDAIENENYYNLKEGELGGDGWRSCRKWMESHPEEASKIYDKNAEKLSEWAELNPELTEKNIQAMLDGSRKYWKEHPKQQRDLMQLINQKKKEWQKAHPEQYQKQIDEWRQKGSETNSKPVFCITTGETFKSICAAARHYNIPQGNISQCLQGKRKSAGKHPQTNEKLFWKFLEK